MKKLFVLIAAACMTCTAAFAQTVKPFKEGERAVFLGNGRYGQPYDRRNHPDAGHSTHKLLHAYDTGRFCSGCHLL